MMIIIIIRRRRRRVEFLVHCGQQKNPVREGVSVMSLFFCGVTIWRIHDANTTKSLAVLETSFEKQKMAGPIHGKFFTTLKEVF